MSRLEYVLQVGGAMLGRMQKKNQAMKAERAYNMRLAEERAYNMRLAEEEMKEKKQAREEEEAENIRLAEFYVRLCYNIEFLQFHGEYTKMYRFMELRDELYWYQMIEALTYCCGMESVRIPTLEELEALGRDLVLKNKPPEFEDATWNDAKKFPEHPGLADGSIARVFWGEVKKMAMTRL